jgi:hypothetical protein
MDMPDNDLEQELGELDLQSATLFAEAALGVDARHFLSSDLGRFMVGCARQDYETALQKLKTTPAWRWRRIRDLQFDMWKAEKFCEYLKELMVQGKQAERLLQESED